MKNLFSDPARHWQNGALLFELNFMGGVDPKLYQLYVYVLRGVSAEIPEVVAAITGLLCALMAVVWYRACRELFPRIPALVLGCIIAASPSFTALYTLFLNETLALVLLGAAFWQTFRAIRKQCFTAALWAITWWILACFTRAIFLPMAAAVIWYLLARMGKGRVTLAAFAAGFFLLCVIPAGMHSQKQLNVFAPFGLPEMNEFYFFTGAKIFEIDSDKGLYGFSSPSFYYPIGDPFFTYQSCRPEGPIRAHINTQNGMADWKAEIARVQAIDSADKFWCGLRENLVFLAIGNSWPDSAAQSGYKTLYYANFLMRWMWLPLMLAVLCMAPFVRRRELEMLVLSCALGLLLLLAFQTMVINEGRYRKMLEPLLLLSAYILDRRRVHSEAPHYTMWEFLREVYFKPVFKLISLAKSQFGAVHNKA